jgi:hypothetical protein
MSKVAVDVSFFTVIKRALGFIEITGNGIRLEKLLSFDNEGIVLLSA